MNRAFVPLTVEGTSASPPPGWRWELLVDLARLESGHTPSRYHPEWWGGDIPWISLADIRDLDGRVTYETREHTNEAGIANSAARVLPEGTVVLSRTASVGFVTIMGRPMATSQDFVNWVCTSDLIDPWFLAHLFIGSRSYIRSLASGAIHQTVYVPTVEKFRVCVPSLEEQRRISDRLKAQLSVVERMRASMRQQQEALADLPGRCCSKRSVGNFEMTAPTRLDAAAITQSRLADVFAPTYGTTCTSILRFRWRTPYGT